MLVTFHVFTATSLNMSVFWNEAPLLTLFKKIIAVYTENHAECINTKCRVTDS
jgi:hypothetical protein